MMDLFLSEKRPKFRGYILIRYVNMLTTIKYNLINLQPDNECFINSLCRNSVILLLLTMKFPKIANRISSILGSLPKNNKMIFYDKFNSYKIGNLNIPTFMLLKILHQELTSKEKDYKPYWTHAYKELSMNLLSPIKIDLQDSDSTSLNISLKKPEEKLPLLTMKPMKVRIKVQNKNSHRTCYPSFISTVVDKWEEEVTKPIMKSVKIQLKMNKEKKQLYNGWLATSNYVFNKSVSAIKQGHSVNFQDLRNKFVTANTKKNDPRYQEIDETLKNLRNNSRKASNDEKEKIQKQIEEQKVKLSEIKKEIKSVKNEGVFEWELETPKDIRSGAVDDLCNAYKTSFTNLKKGNIKRFNMDFRRKRNMNHCMVISKNLINIKDGNIIIGRTYFDSKEKATIKMGKKTIKKHKNINIECDCRMVKKNNEYWLIIPVKVEQSDEKPTFKNYCGVDPGIRTLMTTFGNNGCYEFEHNNKLLKNLDEKIKHLKKFKKHIRKRKMLKIERYKEHLIDEIHWKTIHLLLKENDVLFYGDIKSHNFTRKSNNRNLNRDTNNLKFYKFKQRLEFKALEMKKKVIVVKEHFTTKTCSFCGTINDPKNSKVYHCKNCNINIGRDVNASKNILMKGLIQYV